VARVESAADPFLRLAESLRELEVVIGEKARPVVAEVSAGLRDAAAARERGDIAAALVAIRLAMERLAALGSELEPREGMLMRAIAERFADALAWGRKGDAKAAVEVMRRRAGDTRDDPDDQW
jgi:hypothetical protein